MCIHAWQKKQYPALCSLSKVNIPVSPCECVCVWYKCVHRIVACKKLYGSVWYLQSSWPISMSQWLQYVYSYGAPPRIDQETRRTQWNCRPGMASKSTLYYDNICFTVNRWHIHIYTHTHTSDTSLAVTHSLQPTVSFYVWGSNPLPGNYKFSGELTLQMKSPQFLA